MILQGRVRILSLIVKLFSVSRAVAAVISSSKLLDLIEAEVRKTDDTLTTLSIMELLSEMAETEHAAEFLPKTNFLQLLGSMISNSSSGSILRSRAMMISGRMLSRENVFMFFDETTVLAIASEIGRRLNSPETIDDNECESAIEAVGQIGSYKFLLLLVMGDNLKQTDHSKFGAELLLLRSIGTVKFVSDAAFDRQRRGKQLVSSLTSFTVDIMSYLTLFKFLTSKNGDGFLFSNTGCTICFCGYCRS
ncbi:Protein SMG8 [Bienertia sinuspersici]